MHLFLFAEIHIMLLFEFLFGSWVAHVLGHKVLPVVARQGLGDFVDLWLKCILAIHFLFFHFFDDFFALLVSLVKSFNSIFVILAISFWITFTNNF